MTRRDKCHRLGRLGGRLKPATAAQAWMILMADLEDDLSERDIPKFENLLAAIQSAFSTAHRKAIADKAKHLAANDFLSTWRNVTVTMPDSDITVLVTCPDGAEPVWFGYHDGECWRAVDGSRIPVTYWQPLPDPPPAPALK